jgi:uncharacterized protein YprB with RNaseH-like and TPR domain
MSSTLDRLRRLQGLRKQKKRRDPELPPRRSAPESGQAGRAPARLEEVVDGRVIENQAGTCFVVERRYRLDERRGPATLGALLHHEPALFAPIHPAFNLDRAGDYLDAAFIDTETTGLGGGAGVYAFMVGVGVFEGIGEVEEIGESGRDVEPPIFNPQSSIPNFVFTVRQFFMRSPAEEGAMLVALADLLSGYGMTVTFNGRTFDLPLLRGRFQMNHWLFPGGMADAGLLAPDRPHLDLLHPARKLWRRRLGSVRLINLEERILGRRREARDAPGHLIPQLYADFIRSGDATRMGDVFYHNREDIVSMVSLAEALSHAFGHVQDPARPPGERALHGAEWVALGRVYEQLEEPARAEAAYRQAIETTRETGPRADAFARLGLLLKRQARWAEAADVWQQWLSSIPDCGIDPYVELAKICEWRVKDLEQAEMWTGWALHNLRAEPAWQQDKAAIAELEHRLARIRRKRNCGR